MAATARSAPAHGSARPDLKQSTSPTAHPKTEVTLAARIIDGKAIAAELRIRVGATRSAVQAATGIEPGLAVVLAGEDPASRLYVDSKSKQAAAVGIRSFDYRLPASVSTAELYRLIDELNAAGDVHGILVQLPLPKQVDETSVLLRIDPAQGRRWFPSDQRRPPRDRARGHSAMHAARQPDPDSQRPARPCWCTRADRRVARTSSASPPRNSCCASTAL